MLYLEGVERRLKSCASSKKKKGQVLLEHSNCLILDGDANAKMSL